MAINTLHMYTHSVLLFQEFLIVLIRCEVSDIKYKNSFLVQWQLHPVGLPQGAV